MSSQVRSEKPHGRRILTLASEEYLAPFQVYEEADVVITESMKYWTVLDVTPSATMGLYQRRAEILRSAQNDKHFLLSLVTGSRGVD